MAVAVLTAFWIVAILDCRRFYVSPFLLSPFRLVAIMTGTRDRYHLQVLVLGALCGSARSMDRAAQSNTMDP